MGRLKNRIAVDSMIWIYILERNPSFYEAALDALRGCDEILISSLAIGEVLVGFEKRGDHAAKLSFLSYIDSDPRIHVVPFNENLALNFAKIRAKYPYIKSPDAIHLATAQLAEVDYFLTNDSALQSFEELEVKLLLN